MCRRYNVRRPGRQRGNARQRKTGKRLTIAGGVSPANNVEAVQFNCDTDQAEAVARRPSAA
jgi:protein involved in polysaccharide export with SLBB domain